MKNKFNFHTDSGHGWLAVKRKLLENLGIIDKITRFSYQKGATVYLEEDQDLETFAKAFKAHYGRGIIQVYPKKEPSRSPVRYYPSFSL